LLLLLTISFRLVGILELLYLCVWVFIEGDVILWISDIHTSIFILTKIALLPEGSRTSFGFSWNKNLIKRVQIFQDLRPSFSHFYTKVTIECLTSLLSSLRYSLLILELSHIIIIAKFSCCWICSSMHGISSGSSFRSSWSHIVRSKFLVEKIVDSVRFTRIETILWQDVRLTWVHHDSVTRYFFIHFIYCLGHIRIVSKIIRNLILLLCLLVIYLSHRSIFSISHAWYTTLSISLMSDYPTYTTHV
jgi:hypothetical protein